MEVGGATLELRVNTRREVTNPDARFFPGDVIELPLFKLLALAGKASYASLSFDPNGHFFLCNTVQGEGEGAKLHENRVAMRFQALVSAARGAFHDLDVDLFTQDPSRGEPRPHADVAGHSVAARGILYGGSLTMQMGATSRLNRSKHRWWVTDLQWAAGPTPMNLPSAAGLATLANGPLTAGWACSPCQLFFSYFMMNMYSGPTPRGGGVGPEIQHDDSPLLAHFDTFSFANHTAPAAAGGGSPSPAPPPPTPAETSSIAFGGPPVTRDAHNHVVTANWGIPPASLAPISVFTLSHHELAIVKLERHTKLLTQGGAGDPPVVGFLAAFDPLSGAPAPIPDGHDDYLFDYEAAGQLKVARVAEGEHPGTYSGFSCRPFKFVGVGDNQTVRLFRASSGDVGMNVGLGARHGSSTGMVSITRLKPAAFQDVHGGAPDYKPLTFSRALGRQGPIGLPEQFHAERAVPYPTMGEAADAYPDLAAVAEVRSSQVAMLSRTLAAMQQEPLPTETRAAARAQRARDDLDGLITMLSTETNADD